MKTTVDIPTQLLRQARRAAAEDGSTLKGLLVDGLRQVLAQRSRRAPFQLRRVTFDGEGLQRGVREGSWSHILELAYEGRGA